MIDRTFDLMAAADFAAAYWKDKSKAGEQVAGAVINTASASGTTLPSPSAAGSTRR